MLYRSAIVAALGGLLFGFDTAVISGAEGSLWELYRADYLSMGEIFGSEGFWHGFTVASALIGTILGAIGAGRPADVLGRRKMLIIIGILYLVSAIGSAFAWNWISFVIFRFLGGLGVGGSSVVAPMYIAEISPARLRGRLVALTQLNIVVGMLLAFFSNYVINSMDLGASEWRWMFGVEAFPAFAFSTLLIFNPRSPRWLVNKGLLDEARDVLSNIGIDAPTVEDEIVAIQASLEEEESLTKERFLQARYRIPIFLAVFIAVFNQLSGINAVMYYAPRIFQMAGAGEGAALLQTVAIGGINLVFTIAALLIIDHFGRKKLMIVGSIGYIISLTSVAIAFYRNGTHFDAASGTVVLISLLVFIASHAFGQGAVIWVFISEIFPNRVRARGQALGSFTHWVMAALISWTFPVIAEVSGGHTFAFYALCMVGQLVWVLCVMPETKNVPLENIEERLGMKTG